MNKHRNSSRSKVEQIDLKYQKFVARHFNDLIGIEYSKGSKRTIFINNEEGC
jgi:hypothetical protein